MFGQKDDGTPGQDNGGNDDGVAQGQAADPDAAASNDAQVWQHPGAPLGEPAIAPDPDNIDQPSGAPPAANRDVFSPAGGFPSAPSTRIETSGPVINLDISPPESADTAPTVDASTDTGATDNLVPATPAAAASDADLVEIKQKAIDELAPLIDKLDLNPEDKFRTIMMMIQATDDEALVEIAYEAAHSIEDEKKRAQALLDIVNEINYFTQPENSQA